MTTNIEARKKKKPKKKAPPTDDLPEGAYRDALGFVHYAALDGEERKEDSDHGGDEDETPNLFGEAAKPKRADEFNPVFTFSDNSYEANNWVLRSTAALVTKGKSAIDVDAKIRALRENSEAFGGDLDLMGGEADETGDRVRVRDQRKKKKVLATEELEEEEKIVFDETVSAGETDATFTSMKLSRPLLKALTSMNYRRPSPVQAAVIPIALMGRDLCACANTGTGKTAAFMLPILERLLYKPRQKERLTRVLILVPTRELCIQVYQVGCQLGQNTGVQLTVTAGGLDIRAQEAALRLGPDIVVATPGRLIDHLHNSPSFSLADIEILVLDEADRMLDEFFADQMTEVIRLCAPTRQTMLFSATMSESVRELAAVSLKSPVKVFVNENTEQVHTLQQEFVRIREGREGDREAMLGALIVRNFSRNCIVFIQTKKQAHRLHLLLGLLGVSVGELHSNLSQTQRLDTLRKFKDEELCVLIATDLAARGLDISGVETVVNFTLPATLKQYIHRVGRTARIGRRGLSVTLVGESERRLLKEIVRHASTPLKSRVVPFEVILKYKKKIAELEKHVESIMEEETLESAARATENMVRRVERRLEHGDEPDRAWFQTAPQRKEASTRLRLEERKQLAAKKMTPHDRAENELKKAQQLAARGAKSAERKRKAGYEVEDGRSGGNKTDAKRRKKGSSFEQELTSTSQKSVKKFRSAGNRPAFEKKSGGSSAGKGKSKERSRVSGPKKSTKHAKKGSGKGKRR